MNQDLGLKCGIEIHQQLDTKKKLFCSCRASLSDAEPIGVIERKLRPVSGELGSVDPAVLYEYMRDRTFYYRFYENESCLVDTDDEPPSPMNEETLDIVLTVCILLSAEIPDEIHIMRKIVTDGSNTSGFQRTAIVGLNGVLKTSKGDVSIPVISIEEEAAQVVAKKENGVEYSLDRLGIPLIEIGTGPDIVDPHHAQEVAKKIGMILRSTQKVKRGLGTIRQDVNISIKAGARVEIKGFQDLSLMTELVENEMKRQASLVKIYQFLNKKTIISDIVDVTDIFLDTKNKIIQKALKKNGVVLASKIKGCSGLLKSEVGKNKTLGRELADYVKTYGAEGYIHTDEDMQKYGIDLELKKVKEKISADENDICILLAETKEKAEKAFFALRSRIVLLAESVPKEVRAANTDATSSYLRPLPGAARMYPETDVAPIMITKERLNRIRKSLPELLDDKAARFKKTYAFDKDLVKKIIKSKYLSIFEELSAVYDPKLVVSTLVNTVPNVERESKNTPIFRLDQFREIFEAEKTNRIAKEAIFDILMAWSSSEGVTFDRILENLNLTETQDVDVASFIDTLLREKSEFIKKQKERALSPLMGIVMKEFRGKVSGKKINELLQKKLAPYLEE